jgi:hypothetical protein
VKDKLYWLLNTFDSRSEERAFLIRSKCAGIPLEYIIAYAARESCTDYRWEEYNTNGPQLGMAIDTHDPRIRRVKTHYKYRYGLNNYPCVCK